MSLMKVFLDVQGTDQFVPPTFTGLELELLRNSEGVLEQFVKSDEPLPDNASVSDSIVRGDTFGNGTVYVGQFKLADENSISGITECGSSIAWCRDDELHPYNFDRHEVHVQKGHEPRVEITTPGVGEDNEKLKFKIYVPSDSLEMIMNLIDRPPEAVGQAMVKFAVSDLEYSCGSLIGKISAIGGCTRYG